MYDLGAQVIRRLLMGAPRVPINDSPVCDFPALPTCLDGSRKWFHGRWSIPHGERTGGVHPFGNSLRVMAQENIS
ncbi:hypothetical protein BHE74_00050556 [Ensete ventricosum]|uniref:Uncharacterized protein n=1 Tax=Ensete ventricosum TaxID=4639 RepID=A0A426XGR2_ENSVE|nr:hypothetical protein B296_00029951 [Ensete ventricosum]RWW15420.1 hypothetical protein GW17_00020743 [Ensete ventricosum]RWW43747.1 hypothetical protein BHE74_00050556 [Ensete ventricosum]RZS11051.1 hypothetical protein BHM03_00042353 [Ensete ventricosum]